MSKRRQEIEGSFGDSKGFNVKQPFGAILMFFKEELKILSSLLIFSNILKRMG
jgi:hypothetical protein